MNINLLLFVLFFIAFGIISYYIAGFILVAFVEIIYVYLFLSKEDYLL